MAWQEIRAENWFAFVEVATKVSVMMPGAHGYICRGQANCSWPLWPRLKRRCEGAGLGEKKAQDLEQVATREFMRQVHLHHETSFIEESDPKDFLTWWSVMQHHWAPTRLLDWSWSPYVAAYFAVEQELDTDGALWLVHGASLLQAMTRKAEAEGRPQGYLQNAALMYGIPGSEPEAFIVEPRKPSARMVAQQGLYTVANHVLADHGSIIGNCLHNDEECTRLVKVTIPASAKAEFMRHLNFMNVKGGSLFPGVDGLGKSVDELVNQFVRFPWVDAAE